MTNMPMNSAALAGVPAGVQSQGVWVGRRQLFVRFAGEAETATMYTAQALVRELERQLSRSSFHSIAIGGRDTLGNVQFLLTAFGAMKPAVPVMLDTDGQRPEALTVLAPHLAMTQLISVDPMRHLPVRWRPLRPPRPPVAHMRWCSARATTRAMVNSFGSSNVHTRPVPART